ncbi:MAG: M15 family metallopeptidase [Elusimicrobiota bacterium]
MIALLLAAAAHASNAFPEGTQHSDGSAVAVSTPAVCTYRYTVWNAKLRRSTRSGEVKKSYSELASDETGPLGCTLCREDQQEVELSNGVRFMVCAKAAEAVRSALEKAIRSGQKVETVMGYRVQKSKGPLDKKGERTQWSFHSFGVAVDLNEGHNGLYDRCVRWGPGCRLIKGGRHKDEDPLSIKPTDPVVSAMKEAGFLWGGTIEGRQKDFMHFSPSGY